MSYPPPGGYYNPNSYQPNYYAQGYGGPVSRGWGGGGGGEWMGSGGGGWSGGAGAGWSGGRVKVESETAEESGPMGAYVAELRRQQGRAEAASLPCQTDGCAWRAEAGVSLGQLEAHFLAHHPRLRPYTCQLCGETLGDPASHARAHPASPPSLHDGRPQLAPLLLRALARTFVANLPKAPVEVLSLSDDDSPRRHHVAGPFPRSDGGALTGNPFPKEPSPAAPATPPDCYQDSQVSSTTKADNPSFSAGHQSLDGAVHVASISFVSQASSPDIPESASPPPAQAHRPRPAAAPKPAERTAKAPVAQSKAPPAPTPKAAAPPPEAKGSGEETNVYLAFVEGFVAELDANLYYLECQFPSCKKQVKPSLFSLDTHALKHQTKPTFLCRLCGAEVRAPKRHSEVKHPGRPAAISDLRGGALAPELTALFAKCFPKKRPRRKALPAAASTAKAPKAPSAVVTLDDEAASAALLTPATKAKAAPEPPSKPAPISLDTPSEKPVEKPTEDLLSPKLEPSEEEETALAKSPTWSDPPTEGAEEASAEASQAPALEMEETRREEAASELEVPAPEPKAVEEPPKAAEPVAEPLPLGKPMEPVVTQPPPPTELKPTEVPSEPPVSETPQEPELGQPFAKADESVREGPLPTKPTAYLELLEGLCRRKGGFACAFPACEQKYSRTNGTYLNLHIASHSRRPLFECLRCGESTNSTRTHANAHPAEDGLGSGDFRDLRPSFEAELIALAKRCFGEPAPKPPTKKRPAGQAKRGRPPKVPKGDLPKAEPSTSSAATQPSLEENFHSNSSVAGSSLAFYSDSEMTASQTSLSEAPKDAPQKPSTDPPIKTPTEPSLQAPSDPAKADPFGPTDFSDIGEVKTIAVVKADPARRKGRRNSVAASLFFKTTVKTEVPEPEEAPAAEASKPPVAQTAEPFAAPAPFTAPPPFAELAPRPASKSPSQAEESLKPPRTPDDEMPGSGSPNATVMIPLDAASEEETAEGGASAGPAAESSEASEALPPSPVAVKVEVEESGSKPGSPSHLAEETAKEVKYLVSVARRRLRKARTLVCGYQGCDATWTCFKNVDGMLGHVTKQHLGREDAYHCLTCDTSVLCHNTHHYRRHKGLPKSFRDRRHHFRDELLRAIRLACQLPATGRTSPLTRKAKKDGEKKGKEKPPLKPFLSGIWGPEVEVEPPRRRGPPKETKPKEGEEGDWEGRANEGSPGLSATELGERALRLYQALLHSLALDVAAGRRMECQFYGCQTKYEELVELGTLDHHVLVHNAEPAFLCIQCKGTTKSPLYHRSRCTAPPAGDARPKFRDLRASFATQLLDCFTECFPDVSLQPKRLRPPQSRSPPLRSPPLPPKERRTPDGPSQQEAPVKEEAVKSPEVPKAPGGEKQREPTAAGEPSPGSPPPETAYWALVKGLAGQSDGFSCALVECGESSLRYAEAEALDRHVLFHAQLDVFRCRLCAALLTSHPEDHLHSQHPEAQEDFPFDDLRHRHTAALVKVFQACFDAPHSNLSICLSKMDMTDLGGPSEARPGPSRRPAGVDEAMISRAMGLLRNTSLESLQSAASGGGRPVGGRLAERWKGRAVCRGKGCGWRSTTYRRERVEEHVLGHLGLPAFRCRLCGERTSRISVHQLRRHKGQPRDAKDLRPSHAPALAKAARRLFPNIPQA